MKSERKPLIVDNDMRRFWALVDKGDGTLWAPGVSAEYSVSANGDNEVSIFTTEETATRAAAHALLNYDVSTEPVEVVIFRKGAS